MPPTAVSDATTAPPPRARDPRSELARIRFRRAVTLLLMTLVLPGSAQIVAGRKEIGRIAMRTWFLGWCALIGFVLLSLTTRSFPLWFFTTGWVLNLLRFVLIGLALGWAYLFVNAWMLGEPLNLRRQQRLAMVGINGLLCFSVAGALLFASHLVGVQKDFMAAMFSNGPASAATHGRYNVLLLGGDSGSDRWGLRPDSLNVASVDADTGKTVLFGLPRNMLNFTFPKGSVMAKQFPHGYDCGSTCELNSLVTWAGDHKSVFKGYPDPGIEATKEAVEGIMGLKINYYAMVNLMGFRKLVEAVGGIKLHVRDRIPIGGVGSPISGYIEPGYRKLNGFQTLWFARSRVAADDYSRMARQKCVMSAMLQQISPQTVVLKFDALAKASESTFQTDLPQSEVAKFVDLALKARSQPVTTVSFVPPLINTSHPNIAKIHRMVQQAIDPPAAKPGAKHKRRHASPQTTTQVGGSLGDMQQGYLANQSTDLSSSC